MPEEAETEGLDEETLGFERWDRLKEIFCAALPMGDGERSAFLDRACADDGGLRREARALLAEDDAAGDFLEGSAVTLVMKVLSDEEERRTQMTQGPATAGVLATAEVLDKRYKILRQLAVGGMSEVYEAEDMNLSRRVAIKVLKRESLRNTWVVKKFRQGGEALTKINHPGVEQIHYFGRLPGGEQYLVVEFVKGVTLREMLKSHVDDSRQFSFSEAAEIMRQVGRAVTAIHKANFVHRDLKPENIMVHEEEGEITAKVIDLGIVLEMGSTTDSSQAPGTMLYMAPEQLDGGKSTPATDVYALGEITYEMLTGRHPFNPEDLSHLLELKKDELKVTPRALRPGLNEEAEQIVLKALSLKANRRQQSAREFGDNVARSLLSQQPQSPSRRKLWQVAAASVLVVALSVALGYWLLSRNKSPGSPSQPPQVQGEERTLTYWLTVVRQRDGKTIRATGRETFDTGDVFRFNVSPAQSGALYLLNEGTSGNWHVLFPTPENNKGNPSIVALQSTATEGDKFTNRSGAENGTEKIWLVWASRPVQTLDEIVRQSFDAGLTISDPSQRAALSRFMAEHHTPPPDVTPDKEQSQVTLKGRGEIMVSLVELEHKDWK